MELTRAFIALILPSTITDALTKVIQPLKRTSGSPVRWIPPHNIHLTLSFLGDVGADQILQVSHLLDGILQHHRPFMAQLHELGTFPPFGRPRVIWAGLEAPHSLFELQKDLKSGIDQIGIPVEKRPFSPHLTLGRIRDQARTNEVNGLIDLIRHAPPVNNIQGDFSLVTLFKSELTPTGAIYSPLHKCYLRTIEHDKNYVDKIMG